VPHRDCRQAKETTV